MQSTNATTSVKNGSIRVTFLYIMIVYLVFGIIGNLVVIRVFSRSFLRRRSMVPFYTNISASCLMLTLLSYTVPLISMNATQKTLGEVPLFCYWSALFETLGCVVISLTCGLMMISYYLNFFLDVRKPKRMMITRVGLAAVWLVSACVAIGPLVGWSSYVESSHQLTCHMDWTRKSTPSFAYSVNLICALIYLPGIICISIFAYTRRRINTMTDLNQARALRSKHRMMPVLCLGFFICIIPYSTLALASTVIAEVFMSPGSVLMLELISKIHVVFPPVIHHVLCSSYRYGLTMLFSNEQVNVNTNSMTNSDRQRTGPVSLTKRANRAVAPAGMASQNARQP
uniref:Opsin n=2 Tax=Nematostella vectensis TaxID=45351 RepID=A9UMZ4_NEMVE|nr:TPA: opsin [Nematostella vectensis]